MAIKLIEIPIIEDIYDFDSITLKETTERVQNTQVEVEKLVSKEQQHLLWLKKAKRYLELALSEIEERKAVENFGNYFIKNGAERDDKTTQDYLAEMSSNGQSSDNGNYSNADYKWKKKSKNISRQPKQEFQKSNQKYGNVDEWIRLHELLSQATPSDSQKENITPRSKVSTTLNPVGITIQQHGVAEQIEEEEEDFNESEKNDTIMQNSGVDQRMHTQFGSQKDLSCNESVVSGMSYGSSRSSQLKYLSHHKRLKNKNKQELMLEFIKQTLEKTRITSNEMSTPFYSSGGRFNQSEDDGISIKKKKKKLLDTEGIQQRTKASHIRASLDRPMQSEHYSNHEYANIQSRIKQDLEQQRLRKLENTYFTTGKASYPKYKPPAEKKIDPEEERKKKTKNFLKRSTASVVLPPLLSQPQLPQQVDSASSKSGITNQTNQEGELQQGGQFSQKVERILEVKENNRYKNKNGIIVNKIILQPLETKGNKIVQTGRGKIQISHRSTTGQGEIGEVSQEEESDGIEEDFSKQTGISISGNSKILKLQVESKIKINSLSKKQLGNTKNATEREEDLKEYSIGLDGQEILQTFQDEQMEYENQQFQERDYFLLNNDDKNNQIKDIQKNDKSNNHQESRKEEQNKDRRLSEYLTQRESKSDNKVEEEKKQQSEGANGYRENRINILDEGDQIKNNEGQQITNIQTVIEKERPFNNARSLVDQNSKIMKSSEDEVERSKHLNDEIEDKGEDIIRSTNNDRIVLDWQEREKDENPSDSDDDGYVNGCENNSYQNEFLVNESRSKTEIDGNTQNFYASMEVITERNLPVDKGQMEINTDRSGNPISGRGKNIEIEGEQKQLDQQSIDIERQKMGNQKLGFNLIEIKDRYIQNGDEKESDERIIEIDKQSVTEKNEDKNIQKNINKLSKDLNPTTITGKYRRPSIVRTTSQINSNPATPIDLSPSSQSAIRTAGSSSIDIKDNSQKGDIKREDGKHNNNKEFINKSRNQMDPQLNQSQDQSPDTKKNKKILLTKSSASAQVQQQATSQQNKLLSKMIKELGEDINLIDYSSQIPSFQHLFSGYYNAIWSTNNPIMGGNIASMNTNSSNFSLIDNLRTIYSLFAQHVEKVDKTDKALLRYKAVITPLEVLPSEVYYINDPTKVAVYQNRVDIDIRKFIERQIILTQRMNGENFAGHLLPHEEFYFRVVKSKPEVYDIISRSFMRKRDWFELPHGLQLKTSWNLLWTWSKPQIDFNKLLLFQKVNHFPFNKNLVRKDLLKKNFERITKLGQKAAQSFNILPVTFVLPKEYCNFSDRFYEDTLKEGENNIWIMKPIGKSQGRGISLVNDISQVVFAEPVVVQKYMKNPLLLDGYKFDMRIYALVTHMKPLEAFVYKEGFARLSTEKYALNSDNIKNNQIHLTNFSIQKHHYDYAAGTNFIGGTKISLKMLQEKLNAQGISWEKIWIQVQEIIVKSLLACQADIPNNPNSFEIFGYDIIIDNSLKCVLLEINSSPSLARDFIIDDLIKQQMVDDAIDLIKPIQFDRQRLLEVFDRRIREEQGNKSTINVANNSKLQLNRDLNYILRGQKIRNYGEIPKYLGQWQPIAPTAMSEKYYKIIQSYKLPTVKQNTASAANNNNTID